MSTAALLWTHNEPDVLLPNLRYLLTQVDEILIRDRDSDDGVWTELEKLAKQRPEIVLARDDGRFRHDQSKLMTDMAREALERGHEWVVPIDPDEVWHARAPLNEFLGGVAKDVAVVKAEVFNHVASAEDPVSSNPFESIVHRQKFPLPLPKVAARCRPDLTIEGGNHGARTWGVGLSVGPLMSVRHFPYRTEDQFIEKVRSNHAELKRSSLPASFGVHIRAYGHCLETEGEEALRNHFRHWFYSSQPGKDKTLICDPAPI